MSSAEDIVYVSWGGSGRNDTLEDAARRAKDAGVSFIFLGVVDNQRFGDLPKPTMKTLLRELEFILRSQTFAVMRQINGTGVETQVVVRQGEVAEAIKSVAETAGVSSVLVGGPLPIRDQQTAAQVIDQLQVDTGLKITLI
ncbi:MAG: universal stress protein [Acidimicrobiales bacterium]|nr:universal stress protein [Acidimicrobiales bacterium]